MTRKDIIPAISDEGFQATPVGLVVAGKPSYAEWEKFGRNLGRVAAAYKWCWGDWLAYGEANYYERYSQALDETDWAYGTLANAARVCKAVEFSRRREKLSFEHHVEVAKLTAKAQDEWLDDAEAHGWTHKELRQEIKDSLLLPGLPKVELPPEGKMVVRQVQATIRSVDRWRSAILAGNLDPKTHFPLILEWFDQLIDALTELRRTMREMSK